MAEINVSHTLEKQGLRLSIYGALSMAALGIGFAVLTSSDAVLLDGLFSLVGCVVGVIALRVAALVTQPGDDIFPFGYAAYEPMLNLTKGLLMAFITLFALVSAITVVYHGGNTVQAGWASIYAGTAAAGCFFIAFFQFKLAGKTNSPLLVVDAKNWLVDGVLSGAVLIAFLVAFLLADSKYTHLLGYTDPVVVIVLVILSFPIPATIIRDNWNQLVGRAPDAAIQDRAKTAVLSALGDESDIRTEIRMQQIGRFTYVQLYVIFDDKVDASLDQLDECRQDVQRSLSKAFSHLALDVVFTRDARWVEASLGNPNVAVKISRSIDKADPSDDASPSDDEDAESREPDPGRMEGDS